VVVRRHRFKQSQPLEERLAQDTAQLREKAEVLPPGGAREQIMRRITQNEAASDLCEMLRSPGAAAHQIGLKPLKHHRPTL
jgi:hypothetical protein